jgi:hypothetical protein
MPVLRPLHPLWIFAGDIRAAFHVDRPLHSKPHERTIEFRTEHTTSGAWFALLTESGRLIPNSESVKLVQHIDVKAECCLRALKQRRALSSHLLTLKAPPRTTIPLVILMAATPLFAQSPPSSPDHLRRTADYKRREARPSISRADRRRQSLLFGGIDRSR